MQMTDPYELAHHTAQKNRVTIQKSVLNVRTLSFSFLSATMAHYDKMGRLKGLLALFHWP